MAFSIPDSYIDAVKVIASLESADADEIARQFKLIEPSLSAASILASMPDLQQARIQRDSSVIDFLLSVHKIQLTLGEPYEIIVGELSEAAGDYLQENSLLESFISNCLSLLSPDSALRVSAKAIDLFAENAAGFKSSRIISDIRPVFKSDEEVANPAAAIINHTLKIDYGEREGPKQIFIAMDYLDLLNLREAVERAINKESCLRRSLLSSDITFLSPQDDS